MHVAFQGATWDLNKDVVDKIGHYSGLFEDIPELNTFMRGLLLSDIHSAVKAYFWCYVLIWPLLQLGTSFAAIFIAGVIFAIQNRPKVKRISNGNDTTVNWVPTPVQASNLRLFETGNQAAILMSSFDISYQAGGKTITENIKTKTPLGNKMLQRLQLKVSANNPKQIFIDGIQ